MIYLQLFLSFFQIGLFSFGGGYAMIPLIQHELERHGWMTSNQFVDIIAISQMTPGPLSVNAATFVGYKMAGIAGGMVATLGRGTAFDAAHSLAVLAFSSGIANMLCKRICFTAFVRRSSA